MPFDGIVANAVAKELDRTLAGGRIGKIQQPTRETIVLQVRAGGENHRLLVCCGGAEARVQLTRTEDRENPASPPMFCMLLRKHLSGGLIRQVRCPGFERILVFEVETEDELGDRSTKKLVVEVMGRQSNIILLNRDDIILDAARHVDNAISRVREVLPAHPYVQPPAQDKLDPSAPETPLALLRTLEKCEKKLAGALLDGLRGFSPVLCREVCHLATLDPDMAANRLLPEEQSRLLAVLERYRIRVREAEQTPCTITDPFIGKVLDFHVLPLTATGSWTPYDSSGAAMDAFFGERDRTARLSGRRTELARTVNGNLSKVQTRLQAHLDTLAQNSAFDTYRRWGEILTANIHALQEGMDTATLQDWYAEDDTPAVIALDPNLSPQRNAQRYFRRYQKGKVACKYAESQLEGLHTEADYLESLLYSIENASDPSDFQEIREEMIQQEYLKPPAQKKGKGGRPRPVAKTGKPLPAEPLRILSKESFEIFIGRNNRQNDRLTLKMARAEDLWFHVKSFSGSHVVIRTGGRTVPAAVIEEAAAYAAWHSKARNTTKAEVDYTAIRHVKKPSGGKPGMVIYVNYQTVVVAPVEPNTLSTTRPTS